MKVKANQMLERSWICPIELIVPSVHGRVGDQLRQVLGLARVLTQNIDHL